MSKVANFSIVGELPRHQPSRHCLGFVKVKTLYFLLTSLLFLQFVTCLAFTTLPTLKTERSQFLGRDSWSHSKQLVFAAFAAIFSSVWLVFALVSFVGILRNNPYLHFPLLVAEAAITLFAAAGVALFAWKILAMDGADDLDASRFFLMLGLLIFHTYYTYIIFSLYTDVRSKKKTDEFIARQKMIDEVCEEMYWEELADTLAVATPYQPNVYELESYSSYTDDSFTSFEMAQLYANRQPTRFVTFYDEHEQSF